ncbi:HAD family hydrolase [Vibrio jasicida]|uniref:HAD family hydrolase n=1 Tax=Vibrio jasicida TaxID=766224 RepID=UPI000CE3459F|nr:HAD-IA family hydrolase [Vibrio jasicida]
MEINKSAVWVFDLDDTLYTEKDYQRSGYLYIAHHLNKLYQQDVSGIIEKADAQNKDVLQEICRALSLPDSVKQSLLWMYRLHIPTIELTPDAKCTLEVIKSRCSAIAVITDGRSVSQRNKLLSLGLEQIDSLVSEEWGESKPGDIRFKEIERRYPNESQYIYVGDNVKKDFITPKKMNWLTIGIRDAGNNIHSQDLSEISDEYLPHFWVNSLSELQDYVC